LVQNLFLTIHKTLVGVKLSEGGKKGIEKLTEWCFLQLLVFLAPYATESWG